MKRLMLASVLALASLPALATIGFSCKVSLNNGTRFEVGVTVAMGMGSALGGENPVVVLKNDKLISTIGADKNAGTWFDNDMLLLNMLDADMNATAVKIEYFGEKSPKNKLTLNLDGARGAHGPLVFRDVACDWEE